MVNPFWPKAPLPAPPNVMCLNVSSRWYLRHLKGYLEPKVMDHRLFIFGISDVDRDDCRGPCSLGGVGFGITYLIPSPTYLITYYTILYYTILYYTILYYTILYYTILYYAMLYYTILYYTILYYTILYYTILYYTILYYTILYYLLYYTILDYTRLY